MAFLLGADFSFDKPDLNQLWAAGHRVILVYLSTTSSKGVSKAYCDQALSIGFKVLPIYETTAGAALGGHATGVDHRMVAEGIAHTLDIPIEVPIEYALDRNFTTAELAGPVTQYCLGAQSGGREAAFYGGYNQLKYLLDHGVIKSNQNWQTYAWSSGKWLPIDRTPIQQYNNGEIVASGTVDLNRVDDSCVFWEENMALTDDEITKIAKRVWDIDYIPVDPTNVANPTWMAKNSLADVVNKARTAAGKPSLTEIVTAVVAALPPGQTAGLTEAQLEAIVRKVVAKLSLNLAA